VRILALETSSLFGSVATLTDEQVVAEARLVPPQRTAQSLAPSIDHCLNLSGWTAGDIELVAVSQGPGSFTGLRLGATTAKVLAYACSAHLIGINTLMVIAAQVTDESTDTVTAVLDAQRQQLYTATFIREEAGQWRETISTRIVDENQWLAGLTDSMVITGTGLKKIVSRIPVSIPIVDESLWHPRATTLGRLALAALLQGRSDDYWQFIPNYYRRSAAEEKRDG